MQTEYDDKKNNYKEKYDKFKAKEETYDKIVIIRDDLKKIKILENEYKEASKTYSQNSESMVNRSIQNVAAKLLRKKALHQGSHKNTTEYNRMINALEEVVLWPKDKDNNTSKHETLEDAIQNLKTQSEAYLKAKNEQRRLLPSIMRRHRKEYAQLFIDIANISLDDKEVIAQENIRTNKLEQDAKEKESKAIVEPMKEEEITELGFEM